MAKGDREISLEDGPYVGMLDSYAPTTKQPGKYRLGRNVYCEDAQTAAAIVGRPGVRQLGANLNGGWVSAIADIYTPGGVLKTIAIAGGEIYTLAWGNGLGEVWTRRVTVANLTTAGITLEIANPIAVTHTLQGPVISDGVNTPFLWDGSAGAGGLTLLVNAPVFFGPPAYGEGRLFGITASDRRTIVWSQVNAVQTGYTSGGYTNAWTLSQTDPDRLFAIRCYNGVVRVWRSASFLELSGDPANNFQTTNTKDNLDDTHGTESPFAIVDQASKTYYIANYARPYMYRSGANESDPLWHGFEQTLKAEWNAQTALGTLRAVLHVSMGLLLMDLPNSHDVMVFDASGDTPVPIALWDLVGSGTSRSAMTVCTCPPTTSLLYQNKQFLLIGTTGGDVYQLSDPREDASTAIWDDQLVSGTVAIAHSVETGALGDSVKRNKIFDRLDINTLCPTQQTLNVTITTPSGTSASQQVIVPTNGTEESHAALGLDDMGRWARAKIAHATVGEQFGITAASLTAFPTNDDPSEL